MIDKCTGQDVRTSENFKNPSIIPVIICNVPVNQWRDLQWCGERGVPINLVLIWSRYIFISFLIIRSLTWRSSCSPTGIPCQSALMSWIQRWRLHEGCSVLMLKEIVNPRVAQEGFIQQCEGLTEIIFTFAFMLHVEDIEDKSFHRSFVCSFSKKGFEDIWHLISYISCKLKNFRKSFIL